jgi:HAD superfamily hydrolase (TIGR01509 family)
MDRHDLAAVLLDMDGTLVDSDAAVERAWVSWCDRYGVDTAAALAVAHGRPAGGTIRELRPDLDDAEVAAGAAYQLDLQYDDLADVVPVKGMAELFAALDRLALPWAVVTSADRRLAAARLGAVGAPPVPVLVTAEDVSAGKPDPEGYLRAAELLGVDPAVCLVVEDADAGIAAGRAAGARVAALKGLHADLDLADLGELALLLTASDGRS